MNQRSNLPAEESTAARADVANTRSYPGGLVSFLLTWQTTGGSFTLLEARMRPGAEPPLHLHEARNVVFYVLEGEMEVCCGQKIHSARAGDVIFISEGVAHTYKVQSSVVRFLVLMQPRKETEGYFEGLSQPASMEFPANNMKPPDPAYVLSLATQHGVKFIQRRDEASAAH